jgi:hypothetical protein
VGVIIASNRRMFVLAMPWTFERGFDAASAKAVNL